MLLLTSLLRPSFETRCHEVPAFMNEAAATLHLSLLSHTNVGKTTLARTLLRRDIGEVGDRPHVTDVAESHVLIESDAGDSLVLWDTPGFGDSARLLKRLKQSEQPLGWILSQVWDRFTDRPFWCSQQAMRTARDTSDAMLYVVNAGESPASAGYVDLELQILNWVGKPIVLLLNQLGPPRSAAETQADISRWHTHVARFPCVHAVLSFDGFARCWVQESTLLLQIQRLLPETQQAPFERLRAAWRKRNLAVFAQSMQVMAKQLARVATDQETLEDRNVQQKARAWIGSVATGASSDDAGLHRAQGKLVSRLDTEVREATAELVRLHGLSGRATEEVLKRIGSEFAVERAADADKAGVIGGLLSGALAGVAADLAAGGLTFGAGALIGGVLGALSAREITRAYNLSRGSGSGNVRWSPEFLKERVGAALIRYLAVAHFGRGRGEFVMGASPPHWNEAVVTAIALRQTALERAWTAARSGSNAVDLERLLEPVVTEIARDVLTRLYPESTSVFTE